MCLFANICNELPPLSPQFEAFTYMKISVRWSGAPDPSLANVTVTVPDDADVRALRLALETATGVRPARQKLLNLRVRGKPAKDEDALGDVKPFPKAVMMMGQLESTYEGAKKAEAEAEELAPEVEDDFEVDVETALDASKNPAYLAKLEKRIESVELKVLNQPRENTKCLVLDIDYTLFDHRTTAERPEEIMRPFLHEFLTRAYNCNYDIIIWSATNMKWIELKMTELGVLSDSQPYKICALIDSKSMVTVETAKYGVFNCKPLGYLWAQKFGGERQRFGPHNTVMFDDLSRNFIMNPQQGLKIRPFRNAHTSRSTDRELLRLALYLEAIASLDHFSELNHKRWESFLEKYENKKL